MGSPVSLSVDFDPGRYRRQPESENVRVPMQQAGFRNSPTLYTARGVERMVFSLTGRRPGFGTISLLASVSSALFGRRAWQRKNLNEKLYPDSVLA